MIIIQVLQSHASKRNQVLQNQDYPKYYNYLDNENESNLGVTKSYQQAELGVTESRLTKT